MSSAWDPEKVLLERLEEVRERLDQSRRDLAAHVGTPNSNHMAEAVLDGKDIVLATTTCFQSRLDAISAALTRVRSGRYGICTSCQQPINPERLEVMPEASLCLSCQKRQEEGAKRRV